MIRYQVNIGIGPRRVNRSEASSTERRLLPIRALCPDGISCVEALTMPFKRRRAMKSKENICIDLGERASN
jgi:hypothetical protein